MMQPYDPRPREPLERDISDRLRLYMSKEGWHTEKLHGSVYQMGIPDLYAMHPLHGTRWIETKRPKNGELTAAQQRVFPLWTRFGVGIWIITDAREYQLLFERPNWWSYALKKGHRS